MDSVEVWFASNRCYSEFLENNMIIILSCLIIFVCTTVSIVRSKKPVKLILAEAKYELVYNVIGSRALMQDFYMKGRNKTELLKKSGKIAVITGGARGIGFEVIKMLLKCDIKVIIGCRNIQMAELMLSEFRKEGIETGDIEPYQLDISSTESVLKFAKAIKEKYPKINYLINNAGIMFGPRIETKDGYESQLSTNYLGHFYLTHLLFENLKNGGEADSYSRIINVSSCAHMVAKGINFEDINSRSRYISSEAYAQSKLAQIIAGNYLNSLCQKENLFVQVNAVHPGIVNTDLFNGTHLKNLAPWIPSLMFKSPVQGALPIVHACISPDLERKGGTYIHNCVIYPASELADDLELQEKLFNFTNTLLGIKEFGKL